MREHGVVARSRVEAPLVGLLFAALLAAPFLVPAFRVLVMKPLWLDELHTLLLARSLPGPTLLSRLGAGADFNPPLLFFVDSILLRVFAFLPEQLVLRGASLVAGWFAMMLIFSLCRDRTRLLPAIIGGIGILAHTTVVDQLYEGRFYVFWLALSLAVAWAVQRAWTLPSRIRLAQLAVLSVALCLTHWFAVFALVCLGAAFLLFARPLSRAWPVGAAMGTGVLALVACVPLYVGQRAVLTVPTWIPAATTSDIFFFLAGYYAWLPYAVLFMAPFAIAAIRGDAMTDAPRLERPGSAGIAAAIGLVALPSIILLFTLVVQPALEARYALPAVGGIVVLAALAANRLSQPQQSVAMLLMIAFYASLLPEQVQVSRTFDARIADAVSAVNVVEKDIRPILSFDRLSFYPVALSPQIRNRNMAFIRLPTDAVRAAYAGAPDRESFMLIERDVATAHNRAYGFPRLVTLDSARRNSSFFLLTVHADTAELALTLFGGHRVCRVGRDLLRLQVGAAAGEEIRAGQIIAPCEGVRAN